MSEAKNETINQERADPNPRNLMLMTDGLDIPVAEIMILEIAETGHNTQVNVYYPEGEGPFPMMVFIHGGAFVTGWNTMDEPLIRQIVRDAKCAVVSPNYRLAPEYQWPIAIDELYEVIRYFVQNAEQYNLDNSRIAIGGSSAGGNLAAALIIKAHEKREIAFQYAALVYPAIDLSPPKGGEPPALSREFQEALQGLVKAYIPKEANLENPLISPAYADPTLFPPLSIFEAKQDMLMYSGRAFANKLMDADIEVLFKCYPNVGHGFMEIAGNGHEEVARDCRTIISNQLKRVMEANL